MHDLVQLRLRYEILNTPLEVLAQEINVPVSILQEDAADWRQWWPESDLDLSNTPEVDEYGDEISKDEIFKTQAETFTERTRRRLAIYNLAKEMILAAKYCKLEISIVDKAQEIIDTYALNDDLNIGTDNVPMTSKDILAFGRLLKDLKSNSISAALQSISFGEDEAGLPTVILKDLSGRNN